MHSRTIQTATHISTALFLTLLTEASEPASSPANQPAPTKVVIVDNFESYTNDQQLANAWYKPPHGGGIHQTLESTIKNNGNFSLKCEYTTTKSNDKFYSSVCRVSQWNLAGCNALQFWFKPDGSGRALLFGMNISSREGKNIHDLWDYTYVPKKGDTTPRIVTVPFSKLVKNAKYADSPDTSPVFKPEALIEVGLCIGGRNDEPGKGVYYFDDFIGVWLAQPMGGQAEPGGDPDGADLIDVAVVSDRILWLEFNDGWVKHSGYHEPRNRCVVYRWPLDLEAAAQTANYTLSSDEDADYGGGRHPTNIGRKSKGSDFAGGTGEVVNNHYLYLFLSHPLKPGKHYELSVGKLAGSLKIWPIRYDFRSTRSEAVHVNQLGYAPRAPVKVGYVSQWMGDRGPLDLSAIEGRLFHLVPARGGEIAFSGKVKRRTMRTHIDSAVPKDLPHQNWSNADVCECDFSSFGQPGEYVLAVEGLGCSYPFRIHEDVYRDAFYVTCRALYHHRAGIELKRPNTNWERKADLHEGHISHPVWGWYHDAGDWDGYGHHSIVPRYLLLAFELAPRNFSDGELNLPESGNGLPDLLDEAAWLIQYYRRSRAVFEGGVTGGRVDGDAAGDVPEQNGYPSYEDTRKWIVQGASAEMTYGYAGLAANLAYCYRQISSQTQQLEVAIADWTREAKSAYAWAEGHGGPNEAKAYASAWLYKLTGEEAFHIKFKEANTVKSADQTIGASWNGGWSTWACFAYATLPNGAGDPELKQAIRGAVLKAADVYVLEPARRHTYRVGRDPYMTSFLGKLTTPVPHEAMLAHSLTGKSEYLAAVFTSADYFLGGNPLNMTWVTGLGQRCPREVLNLDAWALEYRDFQPGIVPYGPSTQDFMSPNSVYAAFWAYDRLYPAKDSWPLAEMWCENRYAVASGEYTVSQTIAPAAATYAYLCATTRHNSPNCPPSIHIASNSGPILPRQMVTLRVEAKDPDGWVQRVDYYANHRMIGHATKPPFSCDWQPDAEGDFTIEAQARDNYGARSYSQPVRIRVQTTAAAGKPTSPKPQ